jgi:hypothetical protein
MIFSKLLGFSGSPTTPHRALGIHNSTCYKLFDSTLFGARIAFLGSHGYVSPHGGVIPVRPQILRTELAFPA